MEILMKSESATQFGRQDSMNIAKIRPLVLTVLLVSSSASSQTFQELYSFCPTWWGCGNSNGYDPQAALTQGKDGDLYGTTTEGPDPGGCGTVFKVTPAGQLTTLASFNNTNGCWPHGALLQGSDGNFYGTTLYGSGSQGSVFSMTPSGEI